MEHTKHDAELRHTQRKSIKEKAQNSVPEQQLLYHWLGRELLVLVPKKRGSGYLRVPYGHHIDVLLDDIAYKVKCDFIGLDGHLECVPSDSTYTGPNRQAKFQSVLIPLLEAHYVKTSREVTATEFWQLHPSTVRRV